MLDGRAAELQRRERNVANWMAPLLSATSGQPITAAQLLGEEPTSQDVEARLREGERKLKAIQRRIKRELHRRR
jgi:hypothetical protein